MTNHDHAFIAETTGFILSALEPCGGGLELCSGFEDVEGWLEVYEEERSRVDGAVLDGDCGGWDGGSTCGSGFVRGCGHPAGSKKSHGKASRRISVASPSPCEHIELRLISTSIIPSICARTCPSGSLCNWMSTLTEDPVASVAA